MSNKIEWDKAPEGATHYDTSIGVHPWTKLQFGIRYFWHYNEWNNMGDATEFAQNLFEKPKSKAWNGEGLAPIGTKVSLANTQGIIKLHPDEDGGYVVDINGLYCIASRKEFEPLDVRTNEQKAIDDIQNIFNAHNGDDRALTMAEYLVKVLKAGKIHNVTWSNNNE